MNDNEIFNALSGIIIMLVSVKHHCKKLDRIDWCRTERISVLFSCALMNSKDILVWLILSAAPPPLLHKKSIEKEKCPESAFETFIHDIFVVHIVYIAVLLLLLSVLWGKYDGGNAITSWRSKKRNLKEMWTQKTRFLSFLIHSADL